MLGYPLNKRGSDWGSIRNIQRGPVAQTGRAPRWHRGVTETRCGLGAPSRGFKSLPVHQIFSDFIIINPRRSILGEMILFLMLYIVSRFNERGDSQQQNRRQIKLYYR